MAWGVFVGHEPMPVGRWLGFALIWLALAVFTGDALRRARVDRRRAPIVIHGDTIEQQPRRFTSCGTAC